MTQRFTTWRETFRVWVGAALIVAMLWAAYGALSFAERQEALVHAERDSALIVHFAADQAAATIDQADRALRRVGFDLRSFTPESKQLEELLQEIVNSSPILIQVGLADRDGSIVLSSAGGAPTGYNVSDRDYFKQHKLRADGRTLVSRPVIGRVTGRWAFQLSRRIDTSDDEFAGIVFASIDPFALSRILTATETRGGGTMSLIGTDGKLYARTELDPRVLSADFGQDAAVMLAKESGGAGVFRSLDASGTDRQVTAYRTLRDWPLVAVATLTESDILHVSRQREGILLAATIAGSATVLFLSWLLVAQARRRTAAQRSLVAATDSLRDREQRLLDVVDTAFDLFWETDTERRIVAVDGPAGRLLELTREHIGDRVEEFAYREIGDEDRWKLLVETSRRRVPIRGFQCAFATPNGRVFANINGKPAFDAEGRFLGYRGSATDITDYVAAETRLRSNESRFRSILGVVAQAIITTDQFGVIDGFNPAAERLFGYSAAEVLGRNVSMLMPEPFASHHNDNVARFREAADGQRAAAQQVGELQARRRDGAVFPIEIALSSWHDGDRLALIAAIRDVTEHKRIEEELRRARDDADHASQIKGEYLATMSHEIRTPLNSILGALSLLEAPNLTAEQNHLLTVARQSGMGLQRIIDDVLDLSKLEARRIQIEPAAFAPASLVAEVTDLLRPMAGDRNIQVTWSIDAAVPERIVADPVRYRQILVNLVGNAVKFTEAGRVGVSLFSDPPLDDKETFLLRTEVADTGIGIPLEVRHRLFQRFAQGSVGAGFGFRGSGLGLSICRELAELMGGAIGVVSEEGHGSTFWFTVRCLPAPAEKPEEPKPGRSPGRPLSILVAEDNEANRTIVTTILERAGHSVMAVGDGAAVVGVAAEGGFDVILMDIRMPVMNGPEATRCIRELAGDIGRVPIVALTADAVTSRRDEYLAAGMTAYLTKPIQPAALLDVLARVTNEHPAVIAEPVPATTDGLVDPYQMTAVRDAMGAAAWKRAVATFQSNARDLVAEIETSLPGTPAFRIAAHTLKGAAGSIGATGLAEAAKQLETLPAAMTGDVAGKLTGMLDHTIEALSSDDYPAEA